MTGWTHPRIANPACRLTATDEIAAEAHSAYTRRRIAYPDLVKAGTISADDARADLEAWRAIAKDWQWVALGEGQRAGHDTLTARIAALDTAISRWLEDIDRNDGHMPEDVAERGALFCAMRWWADAERRAGPCSGHIRWAAAVMHDWRTASGLPTRGQMLRHEDSKGEAA